MGNPEQTNIPGIDMAGTGARSGRSRTRQKRAGKSETPGVKDAIAAFHDAYVQAYGAKPSWGVARAAMMKRLVKEHGLDEVKKRIDQLFTVGLGRWPEPPYTINVLVSQFDRLVAVKSPQRVRPSDVLGKVKP